MERSSAKLSLKKTNNFHEEFSDEDTAIAFKCIE